jgi:TonB family protein
MKWLLSVGGLVILTSIATAAVKDPSVEKLLKKISKIEEPRFPPSVLLQGITSGNAEAIVGIDPTGHVVDCMAVAYTKLEFADEAVAAIKRTNFGPLHNGGQPTSLRCRIRVNFDTRGALVTLNSLEHLEQVLDAAAGGHRISKLGTIRELDEMPTVIHAVSPRYPAELVPGKISGRVVIDFFIDETGKVRLPAVTHTDYEGFVDAAAGALLGWQFAPPTRQGKPVIVRVRQEFIFHPDSLTPSEKG